ncbi:MAG: UTP--glucose-1-phosphate uridylyltransferase [Polyangiaceae bacterium]
MSLDDDLAALPSDLVASLEAHGFSRTRLSQWAASAGKDRDARNRLTGSVEPPRPGDVMDAPAPSDANYEELRARGRAAIERGEVALCVLAGGMATRMGGVVKALVEAVDKKTFLELRLGEHAALGGKVPLWLMTSDATDGPIRKALEGRPGLEHVAVFRQCVSLRLTPEGRLFVDEHGEPSVYATGHGDLPEALAASGLLERFIANGGKTVWIANLDNLGAAVDPALLGFHLAHGGPVTVEVVDKVGSDRGGGPVVWNGRRIIAEEFRLPIGFDPVTVPVFNTNTFLVEAAALAALELEFTFVEVEKKVGDRKAIQFERLLGEITAALEPRFARVPRDGARSRFLPVKDNDELARRRDEIRAVATARGMLTGAPPERDA